MTVSPSSTTAGKSDGSAGPRPGGPALRQRYFCKSKQFNLIIIH